MKSKTLNEFRKTNQVSEGYNIQSVRKQDTLLVESEEDRALFSSLISYMNKKERPHYYAFCPKASTFTQFRFDIDLSTDVGKSTKSRVLNIEDVSLYSKEEVFKFILKLNQHIKELFPSIEKECLRCAVLEKDAYVNKNGKYKNGFHLEYPNLYLTNSSMNILVEAGNKEAEKIFNNKYYTTDDKFHNNAWLIYGGVKKDCEGLNYCTSYFVNWKGEEESITGKEDFVSMFWMFPRPTDTLQKRSVTYTYNMNNVSDDDERDEMEEVEDEKNVEQVETYLSGLKKCRVEETFSWRAIVTGIKNTLGEQGKNVAREWSQTTTLNNFDDDSFEAVWKQDDSQRGIWTLKYFWKKDNPTDVLFQVADQSLADYAYLVKGDSFQVINHDDAYIYNKRKAIWEFANYGDVWYHIVPCLEKALTKKLKMIFNSLSKTQDKAEESSLRAALKQVQKQLSALKSSAIQKRIFTCLYKYKDRDNFIDSLDSQGNLFPICNNRVIDLETLQITKRDVGHRFTFTSDVDYDPKNMEFGDSFFLDLANGNEDLALYLKVVFVYSLSGYNYEQVFFQMIGTGANGKSTFIHVLRKLLGGLAFTPPKTEFVSGKYNNNDGPNPAKLKMKNKRLILCTETASGDKLNSGNIKQLTGGDEIEARACHSNNEQNFEVTGTIIVCTNYPLEDVCNDEAVQRRCRNVPFARKFKVDKRFEKNILSNVNGRLTSVFSSAVLASAPYMEKCTFPECEIVKDSTSQLFDEMDSVKQFIDEECVTGLNNQGKPYVHKATHFYQAYKYYCNENDLTAMSKQLFIKDMAKKGYVNKAVKQEGKTVKCYVGLTIEGYTIGEGCTL